MFKRMIALAISAAMVISVCASFTSAQAEEILYATKIPPQTAAWEIEYFRYVEITRNNKFLAGIDHVATGDMLSSYVAIVSGDVDGDATITSTDFMQIRRRYLGLYDLDEIAFKAADVDCNEILNSTDFMQIRRAFLGLWDICPDGVKGILYDGEPYLEENPDKSIAIWRSSGVVDGSQFGYLSPGLISIEDLYTEDGVGQDGYFATTDDAVQYIKDNSSASREYIVVPKFLPEMYDADKNLRYSNIRVSGNEDNEIESLEYSISEVITVRGSSTVLFMSNYSLTVKEAAQGEIEQFNSSLEAAKTVYEEDEEKYRYKSSNGYEMLVYIDPFVIFSEYTYPRSCIDRGVSVEFVYCGHLVELSWTFSAESAEGTQDFIMSDGSIPVLDAIEMEKTAL